MAPFSTPYRISPVETMKTATLLPKFLAIVLLPVLTAATTISAATFTVTNPNDSGAGSLRQAVLDSNAAAGSDAIVFDAGVFSTPQTITLASVIVIAPPALEDSLTITGPGADLLTISGNDTVQIFVVATSRTASISGMTLARANGGVRIGGAIESSANLTVANSVFDSNEARGGGAIFNGLSLTIINCAFTNNTSTGSGGGLNGGGAIFSLSTISISNSTFTENSEIGGGGGGAVYLSLNINSPGTITNTMVAGNSATGNGGGIYGSFGPSSPITITTSTISDNTANSDSDTTGSGGGLFLTGVGTATVSDSTVSGNRVNGTAGDGGGIFTAVSVTLTNSTVSGNTAEGSGGGVNRSAGEVNFLSTIVANNTDNGTAPDIAGSVVSQGYNLIEDPTGATITGDTATDVTGVDPNLGPLQDNGGPTETHALLAGSPAIDQGNSPGAMTDQRGFIRPIDDPDVANAAGGDGSDIGSFESSSEPAIVPGQLLNISTRLRVETGDNVMIGGFIVTGSAPKTVIIRAIGPSLLVPGKLANPTLELFGPSGLIASNDDWMDAPNQQEIIDSNLAPTNDLESAVLTTLPGGTTAYTAIVRGAGEGTGVGLVEVYDLNATDDSELANISTRGFIQTGDNVMIGGFILGGGADDATVLVRAIGPSLAPGVSDALADPTLEIRDINGALVSSNDNWKEPNQTEIEATGLQPQEDAESALLETLTAGAYTAIVAGQGGTTGVGLVEVYRLP